MTGPLLSQRETSKTGKDNQQQDITGNSPTQKEETPNTTYNHPLSSKTEGIARLTGRKALIQCNVNGLTATVLLDTGAQVSIMDHTWKTRHFPEIPIRQFSEILDTEEQLKICAVDGGVIPFDGWIPLAVNLKGNANPDWSVNVPFLVSNLFLERPLLGFNVLKVMIQEQPENLAPTLTFMLCNAISIPEAKAELLVKFIQADKPSVQQRYLRKGKQDTTILAGQVAWIRCQVPPNRTFSESVVLFEPDDNSIPLGELDIEDGVLEVQNPNKPYVAIIQNTQLLHPGKQPLVASVILTK